AGGLAARRAPVLVVTAGAQLAGLLTLLPAVALLGGQVSAAAIGLGAVAGIGGASGLLLYLRGLAIGPMGVVAPLSAVVGAGMPLVAGLVAGERLGPVTVLALVVALAAILFATAGTRSDPVAGQGILFGLGAGVGFGLFFVALDATPDDSGLVPLLAGRVTSVLLLGLAVLALLLRGRVPAGPGLLGLAGLVVTSGVLDVVANVLFLLATRAGSLSVSGVVVSLYPVVVVFLARVVLRERLTGLQTTGVGLALAASALLAVGG
ncbi:MAG TPA: EamA family transporter, partial [Pseudonocardia sp.]|nr:EamA family transporter [Pseudonocardia sp.]